MKLLLISPCDRVLSDPNFGHSLITVFHQIQIKLPIGSELPANALLPRDWTVFSKWELAPEEEDKRYYSITKVFWPNGELFLEMNLPVSPAQAKNGMAFAIRVEAMPIGQNGRFLIQQSIRIEEDDEFIVGPVDARFSVIVTYDLPALPLPDPQGIEFPAGYAENAGRKERT